MRFKLVETGKSYAEAEESILTSEDKVSASDGSASAPPIIWETGDVAEINSLPVPREVELPAAESLAGNSTLSCIHEQVYCQVMKWAADDPERWARIHSVLLRIYAPRWESIDARDILVGWTGAWLSLIRARQQLRRLQSLKRPLTWNERNEKGGREADIGFWGRLTKRLSGQIPAALSEDIEAAGLLTKLCSKKVKNEH